MNVQPQIQTKYVGIRLDSELDSKLRVEASRIGTTTTEIIRRAIREYLRRKRNAA